MTTERLATLLGRFGRLRIAVVGDFFVDRYLMIDPALEERSLETGLPAHQVVEVRAQPGAAGTVTNNLAALGVGYLFAVGFRGRDGEGYELQQGLEATGVRCELLRETSDRRTPTYTKPMVTRPGAPAEELSRLDIKNRTPTPASIEREVIEALRTVSEQVDAVIVADQVSEPDCGVVTGAVREALAALGREQPALPIWVDSRAHIAAFRDVMVKPNLAEARAMVGHDAPPADVARELARRNGRPCMITLGAAGALAATAEATEVVPGVPVGGPIDIVGAGDSFTAGAVCTLAAGGTLREAAQVGCLVASITIQQLGTTGTASVEQVLERLGQSPYGTD